MKSTISMLCFLLSIALVSQAHAAGPAPYTEPASRALNTSAAKIGAFVPPVGATKDEAVKSMVAYYSSVFSRAGYSLEKSIVQLSTDYNKDPDFLSSGLYSSTPAVFVAQLAEQLNEIRSKPDFKGCVEKSVSSETLRALNNIRMISQRKEAAAKAEWERVNAVQRAEEDAFLKRQEEEDLARLQAQEHQDRLDYEMAKEAFEKNEKVKAARSEQRKIQAKQQKELDDLRVQSVLKNLAGHYENQQGKRKNGAAKSSVGTLEVKVISTEKAAFSLYNNLSAPCKIENEEAAIEVEGDNRVRLHFGDANEARTNKDACAITMTFKEASESVKERQGYDYSIEIDQVGCRSYCDRGGTMLGRYIKAK